MQDHIQHCMQSLSKVHSNALQRYSDALLSLKCGISILDAAQAAVTAQQASLVESGQGGGLFGGWGSMR